MKTASRSHVPSPTSRVRARPGTLYSGLGTSGMTLIELLVAFMVFSMLIAALVSLTTTGLDTWAAGEARKDIYDRAQIVLSQVADDLANVYAENEVFNDGQKDLQAPEFGGDFDGNRQQRVRFVRTGSARQVRGEVPPGNPKTVLPTTFYADFWEVAYVMDPDPAKNVLWRGVRFFSREGAGTLLKPEEYDAVADPLFKKCFRPVEGGVLRVEWKFWTQWTTTWDEKAKIQKVTAKSVQASGPEFRWESTRRRDKKFVFHRPRFDRTNPDFVYPEIVQVTVVMESTASAAANIRLAEAADEKSVAMRLTDTRGMPDAPGMVKIGSEWIEYGGMGLSEITQLKRGQLGTSPAAHAAQDAVHHGETFSTDVRIAAYREAQEP